MSVGQYIQFPNPQNVTVTPSGTQDVNLIKVGGSSVSLGQKTMANSIPFVLASDQSNINVVFPSAQHVILDSGTLTSITNTVTISGTVTANAGTNLNTSALALDASVNGLLLSQASTTSGQKGPLIQAAVTTNAPSYSTGNTDPLSLDTSGLLRISLKDTPANTNKFLVTADPITFASSQHVILDSGTLTSITNAVTVAQATAANLNATVTGTVTANQGGAPWSQNITQVGGSSVTLGQKSAASSIPVVTQLDSSPATINITAQDTASTNTTVSNGQVFVTGTPTANSAASFALASFEAIEVQVTGTWTGTLMTEISQDNGTTWMARGVKQSGVSYIANSFTQNFQGGMNFGGLTNVRVRATAAWTGTATVLVSATINPSSLIISNPQMLRDGTTQSTVNTIKAASTAAQATDTSLVVAISPNSNGVTQSTTPWIVASNVTTTGGMTRFRNTSVSNTAIAVKASAGNLYYIHASNLANSSADTYLQFYNVAQGSVTVGTTTPDLTMAIPAGGVLSEQLDGSPFSFSTAITIAATTTVTGGTAPTNSILVNIGYA